MVASMDNRGHQTLGKPWSFISLQGAGYDTLRLRRDYSAFGLMRPLR
jgi:hypothetical protein